MFHGRFLIPAPVLGGSAYGPHGQPESWRVAIRVAFAVFLRLGATVQAIRGKQWFLTSHAVTTTKTKSNNSSANQTTPKVNMFAVDSENFAQYSYAIPVVMAGANASPVSVIIGMLHGVSWKMVTAVALLPGVAAPVGLALRELDDQRAVLTTPRLKRGAALCLLKIEQPAVDPSMGVLRSMNGTA
jgi:hypothetical protein